MADRSISVSQEPAAKREHFYRMVPSFRNHGLVFLEENILREGPYNIFRSGTIDVGYGTPRGVPNFPSPPALGFDRKRGPPPQDVVEWGACWWVSDRFKQFAENIDPGGFEFAPCDNSELMIDGTSPIYWACGLKRWGDFLDEKRSENLLMREEKPGWRVFVPLQDTRIAVDRNKLGNSHVFGIREHIRAFCDQQFKDAFKAAKLGPLSFEPT